MSPTPTTTGPLATGSWLVQRRRLGSYYLPGPRLALTGTGFILIANGDLARAQTVFEQSLPLYRQTSGKSGG
jgi:hypothetical protein